MKEEKSKRRNQGQIKQRGERTFLVRWFLGRDATGKRKYGAETVHGTKKQAQKVLREKLGRQDRGLQTPSPSSIPLLREHVEAWKGSQSAAALRASTFRGYVELLDRHVLPALGGLRIDAIRVLTIEREVVRPLTEKGRHRTAHLTVAALSNVLRDALKDDALGLVSNPCRGVKVGKKPGKKVPPLSADERKAFREAIQGTDHETLWLVMMLTGLGPGEALGLGWEHLDFEAGELRVVRTLDTKARALVDDTKRASRKRVVPLVPELRAMLRERWMAAGRPPEGLVFTDPFGQPLDLDRLRAVSFRQAVEAAGIKRRVTPYALRHGFCTAAIERGLDPTTVAALMGHSSTAMVLNVYTHVSDERKREAAARIGEALLR